jgi:NitT/TauT family transport system substrate-binding protein
MEENVSGSSREPLRIGYLSTMYHTSIFMKGARLLEEAGIDPQWSLFGTGPAIVDAFSKNKLDVGYIGLAPSIIGISKGMRLKCIAGGHVEGTVVVATEDYKPFNQTGNLRRALSQFVDEKIGVPRRGSLHDVFLRYYLSKFDLDESVEVVNYDWADMIPEAMGSGEIVAAAGTPPLSVLLSRLYGAQVIVEPRQIWPNNPSYGILTTEPMIEKSRDLISKFLKIHKKISCEIIRSEPQRAAKVISQTVGLVDESFVLDTFWVSPKFCASLSEEYVKSTIDLVPVLNELEYLQRDNIRESEVFHYSFIKEIHPEPPHYSAGMKE